MTRRCHPHPQLVGADYWLPVEAFEVSWAVAVGCNNLRCPGCGEAVRADGPPRTVRGYRCACQRHLETWTYRVGGGPEDLYPEKLAWYCAGHPNLRLPVVLDGVPLDAGTDWVAVAAAAMLQEPFRPPGIDVRQAWLVRLFHLLPRERAAVLSAAIAELLYATDPRPVSGALEFFTTERKAPGAERIAAMVTSRRDWLAETPHPRMSGSWLGRGYACCQPSPDGGGEQVRVEGLAQPADHRLGRAPTGIDAQQHRGVGGQVGDPLADRGVGAVAGHDRADGCGDHHGEAVADPAPGTWVRNIGQGGRQVNSHSVGQCQ